METAVAHTLAVGDYSPYEAVGPGGMAVALSTKLGQLTMVVQLPGVNTEDLSAFKLPLQGLAWLSTGANPVGAVCLILGKVPDGSDTTWPIAAPIVDSPSALLRWGATDREDNALLMVMVDSNTNKIAAMRVQGLPMDLVVQMRLMAKLNAASIDIPQVLAEYSKLGPEAVWTKGRKWRLEAESDQLVEQAW